MAISVSQPAYSDTTGTTRGGVASGKDAGLVLAKDDESRPEVDPAFLALLREFAQRPYREVGASLTLAVLGTSNVYLRPGPPDPDAIVLVIGRPFVGWQGRRLGVRLGYSPGFQRYVDSGMTGMLHDAELGAHWWPRRSWILYGRLLAGLSSFETGGPAGEEEAVTLSVLRSRSVGIGGGVRFNPPGGVGFRGVFLARFRSSRATLSDDHVLEPMDQIMLETSTQAVWRPVRRVEFSAGPMLEVVSASRDYLSFVGPGFRLASSVRGWSGGKVEASVDCQRNAFDGVLAREDIYARTSLVIRQDLGDSIRVSGRYSYTVNGSALAIYDADRYTVMLILEARAPSWRG